VARRMPGPGQAFGGLEDVELRWRATVGNDEVGHRREPGALRHDPAPQFVGIPHRSGEADNLKVGREVAQSCQA